MARPSTVALCASTKPSSAKRAAAAAVAVVTMVVAVAAMIAAVVAAAGAAVAAAATAGSRHGRAGRRLAVPGIRMWLVIQRIFAGVARAIQRLGRRSARADVVR